MQFPADIAADSGYVPTPRLFAWAMKDDAGAVALCLSVLSWMDNYDHIADRDVTGAEAEKALHSAMWAIAVDVPLNPFYQLHAAELAVSLANAITTWRVATTLQREDKSTHDARLAYVLRWVPIEFFLHCARLVGGDAWAQEIAPQFWRIMTRDHSFEEFVAECGVN